MAQKPGSIVHVEVHSNDPARTKQFFGDVFGWKFQDIPQMDYTTFEAPSPPNGGVMKPMENMGPTVLNYILSADIDATSKKIEAAGGAILVPKSEISKTGWFAIFREPGGTVQALFQDIQRPRAPARPKVRRSSGRKAKKSSRRRGR